MKISVAAWSIGKNGQSSPAVRQQKVSDFIDICCRDGQVSVLFLCEVHSSHVDDYVSFVRTVYGKNYFIHAVPGGFGNAYLLATHVSERFEISHDILNGLNRRVLRLRQGDLSLVLAHFKSGEVGLTKDRLESVARALDEASPGRWAIVGDMNWDYNKAGQLVLPANSHGRTMWPDCTQVQGGILDWCLAGRRTTVNSADGPKNIFKPEIIDMTCPDHRPVVFQLS